MCVVAFFFKIKVNSIYLNFLNDKINKLTLYNCVFSLGFKIEAYDKVLASKHWGNEPNLHFQQLQNIKRRAKVSNSCLFFAYSFKFEETH